MIAYNVSSGLCSLDSLAASFPDPRAAWAISAQVSQSASALTLEPLARTQQGKLLRRRFEQLKEIVRDRTFIALPPHFYLSSLYTGMGRYVTAYRYLATAMKDNPGQGAYYHQLGVIRRYEGCRPEALAAFQQALRAGMGKDEAAAWRHIGDVQVDLLALGQGALTRTRMRSGFDPNDAGAHLALGRLYLDRNDPERAIVELRAALKISAGSGWRSRESRSRLSRDRRSRHRRSRFLNKESNAILPIRNLATCWVRYCCAWP